MRYILQKKFVLIRNQYVAEGYQYKYFSCVFLPIVIYVAIDVILSYSGLLPVAQSIHIFLVSLLFGSQFYLHLFWSKRHNKPVKQFV